MRIAQAVDLAGKWVALSVFAASLGVRSDADIQARRKELCALLPETVAGRSTEKSDTEIGEEEHEE